MRIDSHPVLGTRETGKSITIKVDGKSVAAYEGETIAAALMATGKKVFRHTKKKEEPRGYFCGIGRCTDCSMTVNGIPQVRTCITLVEDGMEITTQQGLGHWG
ncbi:MAG: (2Fe-2S)-binding protein [Pseudomonadota bacterium]